MQCLHCKIVNKHYSNNTIIADMYSESYIRLLYYIVIVFCIYHYTDNSANFSKNRVIIFHNNTNFPVNIILDDNNHHITFLNCKFLLQKSAKTLSAIKDIDFKK